MTSGSAAVSLPGAGKAATAQLRRVEEAMDARAMGPRLESALAPVGSRTCHVIDAKYEPGVRCIVLYRADDQVVRGDLIDESSDDRDRLRPVVDPSVQLSCFPDDPDLPRLPDVAAPATLRDILRDALRDVLPGRGPIGRCRVELLRYRPAKRATLAVEVRGRGDQLARRAQRLVVKSYHDGHKAEAVAAEAVLLDATIDPAAPLRFAPARAHVPELSSVVYEHVTGRHLDMVLGGRGAAAAGAMQRAASALAAFHRQPVVSRRAWDVIVELDRFVARSARITQVERSTGGVLGDLATRLVATAPDVPAGVVGLVHGDGKPSQFLLRGEREVVLLDLDSCGRADPATDVGTFLATLRQRTVQDVLSQRTTAGGAQARGALAQVFLHAYLQAAGAASDEDLRRRISWYEAVALERKALRAFARAPRSPLTRALVDNGHACLDRLEGVR